MKRKGNKQNYCRKQMQLLGYDSNFYGFITEYPFSQCRKKFASECFDGSKQPLSRCRYDRSNCITSTITISSFTVHLL